MFNNMPYPMFPFSMLNMNGAMPFPFPNPFQATAASADSSEPAKDGSEQDAASETPAADAQSVEQNQGADTQQEGQPENKSDNTDFWMAQMRQFMEMFRSMFRVPDINGVQGQSNPAWPGMAPVPPMPFMGQIPWMYGQGLQAPWMGWMPNMNGQMPWMGQTPPMPGMPDMNGQMAQFMEMLQKMFSGMMPQVNGAQGENKPAWPSMAPMHPMPIMGQMPWNGQGPQAPWMGWMPDMCAQMPQMPWMQSRNGQTPLMPGMPDMNRQMAQFMEVMQKMFSGMMPQVNGAQGENKPAWPSMAPMHPMPIMGQIPWNGQGPQAPWMGWMPNTNGQTPPMPGTQEPKANGLPFGIPVKFLQVLLNMDSTPDGLSKFQNFLDWIFDEYSRPHKTDAEPEKQK